MIWQGEHCHYCEALTAENERLRQPQTDAKQEQLLQECLVKLRDVQGTQAPKQYACNLIKRIERVLQGHTYQIITSERAAEIVRAIKETGHS